MCVLYLRVSSYLRTISNDMVHRHTCMHHRYYMCNIIVTHIITMHAWTYVCMYMCIHTHIHTHSHTYTHTRTCTRAYTHVHVHKCACTQIHTYTYCIYTHMYAYTHSSHKYTSNIALCSVLALSNAYTISQVHFLP